MMKQRGTILIVVLGVLVLLALLGTSFATLQSIERKVTRNYTDEVRAKLVAQSGVESAIDRLGELASSGWYPSWAPGDPLRRSWQYFGTETDETREYLLQTAAGEFSKLQAPLGRALNPSFAYETDPAIQDPTDANSAPQQIRVEGRSIGFSGIVGGTYVRHGDLYSLKVLDCQAQININDGVRWGNRHSVSQNLRRILNVLGDQPEVRVPNLGDKVIQARPPTGYLNKAELRRVLNDDAAYDRVSDLVTTHSRSNPNVVNPVPLSREEYENRADVYPIRPGPNGDGYFRPADANGMRIYRYGHGRDITGNQVDRPPTRPWPLRFWDAAIDPPAVDRRYSFPSSFYHAVWSQDALNPQWIETVERSPVNVNNASRPVLMALTAGLEGFFEVGRKRAAPSNMYYGWLQHRYYYSPDGGNAPSLEQRGSETGFLYRTIPFLSPSGGTTTTPGLSAAIIVEEILACRYRQPSPAISGFSYNQAPFGGPFRSWQQFYAFVDHLVEQGVIVDQRPIFYEYKPSHVINHEATWAVPAILAWYITDQTLVDSPAQRRQASQAAADVLKANFNPNGHLNELNPDRNMYLHVDKTDLICHSTELCFVPMGRFEIESLGYVLASPQASGGTTLAAELDVLTASNNRIVAQSRIQAVVELYYPYHETVQKQFIKGEFGERQSLPTTNNNRATESGPEPDNDVPPLECEYDGYVALPTIGGSFDQQAWKKTPGSRQTGTSEAGLYPNAAVTPMGSKAEGYDADIHSHLQFDHCAHYHVGGAGKCRPIGRWANPVEAASLNVPDKTETIPAPYSPSDSGFFPQVPGRYRLAHSFSLPTAWGPGSVGNHMEGNTRIVPLPPMSASWVAPSDLRIDGAYTELNSAFGYDITSARFSTSATVAFWAKLHWYPENTGKVRTLLSINNYDHFFQWPCEVGRHYQQLRRPLPYGIYYFPSYSYEDPWRPTYMNAPRLNSMVWAVATDGLTTATPGGFGVITPTINHEFEPRFGPGLAKEDYNRFTSSTHAGAPNHIRAHEWVHVTVHAEAGGPTNRYHEPMPFRTGSPWVNYYGSPGSPWALQTRRALFKVNGRELPGSEQITVHMANDTWPSLNFGNQGKSIRLGGEYFEFCRAVRPVGWPMQVYTSYTAISGSSGGWWYCPGFVNYATRRQYFGDATLDEFYYWKDNPNALAKAQSIFTKGRYYRPMDSHPNEPQGDAVFTSQEIKAEPARVLAPGNLMAPSGSGVGGDTTVLPHPIPNRSVYLTAISWTAMAEDASSIIDAGGVLRLKPIVRDYRNLPTGGAPIEMSAPAGPDANGFSYETAAQLFVVVDGSNGRKAYGPYHNEVWSPIRADHQIGVIGTGVDKIELKPGETVRYLVKLRPGTPGLNTLLLATPVTEDVTLFFEHAHVRYVSYAEVRGTY